MRSGRSACPHLRGSRFRPPCGGGLGWGVAPCRSRWLPLPSPIAHACRPGVRRFNCPVRATPTPARPHKGGGCRGASVADSAICDHALIRPMACGSARPTAAKLPIMAHPVLQQKLPVREIQAPCFQARSGGRRRPSGDVRDSPAPRPRPAGAASPDPAFGGSRRLIDFHCEV